jgi:glycosyltransferase involved in cell wall biosynthesis
MVRRCHLAGTVELTGPMSNEKVRALMHPDGILVAPSIYVGDGERDGIPTVLVEAMACGMAVVSTCVSGIPELVVNEHNGLLVPERDEVALADAIQRLLRDRALRESLGRRGQQRVRSDFNIRDSSRRLWSLIQRASQS